MSLACFFQKLCPQSLRAGPWGADPQGGPQVSLVCHLPHWSSAVCV